MKKLIVFSILVAALVFSAVNPWPAVLRVLNYTGDNIYFRLSYHGEQKYFLTATSVGNSADYHWSVFEVARKKYNAEVTACTVTATGTLDMNQNLKLTFVDCSLMRQVAGNWGWDVGFDNNGNPYTYFRPLAFWGEPGMEKPNFYQHSDTTKVVVELTPFNWWKNHSDPSYIVEWEDGQVHWGPLTWYGVIAKTHKLGWANWFFQYDLPASYVKDVTFVIFKNECHGAAYNPTGVEDLCWGEFPPGPLPP